MSSEARQQARDRELKARKFPEQKIYDFDPRRGEKEVQMVEQLAVRRQRQADRCRPDPDKPSEPDKTTITTNATGELL